MNFLEKDLENIIWENQKTIEGREILKKRGLFILGKMYRQLNLGEYGTADLVEVIKRKNQRLNIKVYELKKELICIDTLMQASRYARDLELFCRKKYELNPYVEMILIGKNIQTSDDFTFLLSMIYDVEAYIYHYNIDGLFFKKDSKDWELYEQSNFNKIDFKINFTEARQMII